MNEASSDVAVAAPVAHQDLQAVEHLKASCARIKAELGRQIVDRSGGNARRT